MITFKLNLSEAFNIMPLHSKTIRPLSVFFILKKNVKKFKFITNNFIKVTNRVRITVFR